MTIYKELFKDNGYTEMKWLVVRREDHPTRKCLQKCAGRKLTTWDDDMVLTRFRKIFLHSRQQW